MKRGFSSLLLGLVALPLVSGTALADNVGYYDMSVGQGNTTQEAAIITAGHTPVNIVDLSPSELASVSALIVQNPNNGNYGAEYLAALADIEAAVSAGMALVIHDRYVDPAETILPGGGAFDIRRNFDDDSNIDVINNTTLVTDGPGGVIDDTSLDGGNSSSHGFAVLGSLPQGGTFILSTSDPAEIVTFSYPHGSGGVLYSSIPLDFYLSGSSTIATNMQAYAANVVAYATDEITGIQAIEGTVNINVTKTFTNGITDEVDVMLTCNGGLPLQQSFTIAGGGAGVTFVVKELSGEGSTCTVTESGGPEGYTPSLIGGDEGMGCSWDNLLGGFLTCEIVNAPESAVYTVTSNWMLDDPSVVEAHYSVDINVTCDANILTVNGSVVAPSMQYEGSLDDGESVVLGIDTYTGDAQCSAVQSASQSGVEMEASADCTDAELTVGSSAECVFTNTVFFEGIPTLSQYGIALMALLMLGVGFVGSRRFV